VDPEIEIGVPYIPSVLILQGYWGDIKRLGSRGGAQVGGLGDEVPQKLELFVKLHIIFALKYNKQRLLLLQDKINDITSKILGDVTMDVPPS